MLFLIAVFLSNIFRSVLQRAHTSEKRGKILSNFPITSPCGNRFTSETYRKLVVNLRNLIFFREYTWRENLRILVRKSQKSVLRRKIYYLENSSKFTLFPLWYILRLDWKISMIEFKNKIDYSNTTRHEEIFTLNLRAAHFCRNNLFQSTPSSWNIQT